MGMEKPSEQQNFNHLDEGFPAHPINRAPPPGVFNDLEGYCSQLAVAQQQFFNSIPTNAFPSLPFASQSLTAQQLVSLAQMRLRQHNDIDSFEGSRDKEMISSCDSSAYRNAADSSLSTSSSSVFTFPAHPIHPSGPLHLASPGSTASSKDERDRESVISNAPTPPAVILPHSHHHRRHSTADVGQSRYGSANGGASGSSNANLDKLLQKVNDYGVEAALSATSANQKRANSFISKPTPRSPSTLVLVTSQSDRNSTVGSQDVFICTIQGQLTHGQQLHLISSNGQIFSTTIAQLALDLGHRGMSNGSCNTGKSPESFIPPPQVMIEDPKKCSNSTRPGCRQNTDDTEETQPVSATALIKTESKSGISLELEELEEDTSRPGSDGVLLFSSFLESSKHLPKGKLITACSSGSNSNDSSENGINLEEIKEFAKMFKMKRLSLGLTQTQVGQALSLSEGPAYSQSAICRFEKLDITPKSAQKIKPVLEKWMREIDEKIRTGQITPGVDNDGVNPKDNNVPGPTSPGSISQPCGSPPCASSALGLEASKKRKRRTSFTPQALDLLSQFFERNTHPSGAEMTALAENLNYDREVVRVWFCNKRQALKNTIKKLKHER